MRWLFIISLFIISCKNSDAPSVNNEIPVQAHNNEGFIHVSNSELYYKSFGEGEPIIVIHGGPVLDHSYLVPQLESLAENHRLIFYDQRACGKSPADQLPSHMSLDTFVEDIERIRLHLDLGKINILAHSWGGLLGMKYVAKYGDKNVDKLILSNSIPPSSSKWSEEERLLATRVSRADSLQRSQLLGSEAFETNPASVIHDIMMLSFKIQFSDTTKLGNLALNIPEDFMKRSQTFQNMGRYLAQYDLTEDLRNTTNKTKVIYGDYEPAAKYAQASFIDVMPDAELLIIRDCGHFPFVEQEQIYKDAILSFLKS